jgi:hypothetical protein
VRCLGMASDDHERRPWLPIERCARTSSRSLGRRRTVLDEHAVEVGINMAVDVWLCAGMASSRRVERASARAFATGHAFAPDDSARTEVTSLSCSGGQCRDTWILLRGGDHHVTPLAEPGLHAEQDALVLGLGLVEDLRFEVGPDDASGGRRGACTGRSDSC